MAQNSQTNQEIVHWRVEELLAMGFGIDDACDLADARDADGWPISLHDIRTALANGCSHAVAYDIWS